MRFFICLIVRLQKNIHGYLWPAVTTNIGKLYARCVTRFYYNTKLRVKSGSFGRITTSIPLQQYLTVGESWLLISETSSCSILAVILHCKVFRTFPSQFSYRLNARVSTIHRQRGVTQAKKHYNYTKLEGIGIFTTLIK